MAEGTVQLSSAIRAPCSVCRRVMPLTRAGLVRVHGPVSNRCPGSRLPPAPSGLSAPSAAPVIPPHHHRPHHAALPSQNQEPEASCLFGLPHLVKTVERIPRASRDVAARKMAAILQDVISCFATRCLRIPKRGGHCRSLATQLNQTISDEADPDLSASPSQRKPSNRDPLQSLAARVASKLEEDDFRGAIHLASSEDTIAELNNRTLTALKEKHPPPHPDSNIPTAPSEEDSTPIKVSVEEVSRAIRSFPCGSAGGPDGLRPQHLKDMTSTSAKGGGPLLLEALTAFVNLVLEGKTPAPVHHFFFCASL